jgi:membrane dipeptidase
MKIDWVELARAQADRAHGETVEIDGFLCPLAPGASTYFALVEDAPCCIGCVPRDPARRVEVFLSAPIRLTGQRLRLSGTWRVLHDDTAGWRYQLRDAVVVSAPARNAFTRRGVLAGSLLCLAAAAPAAPDEAAQDLQAAKRFVAGRATVDVHSHAGSINGVRRIEQHAALTPLAEPMRDGGMAVVCLAIVSDAPTHRVMTDGRIHPYRAPEPGELHAFAQLAFQRVHDLASAQGLAIVRDAAQLAASRSAAPAIVVAAEGADFLEGQPDRVDEAYERWQLRHLQLTHYRVNELGDIQTEPPVHGGLTDIGAEVIRRCNRRGLVVDVAHGTYDLVKRAASVTSKPLLLSHTSLSTRNRAFTRTITPDHARVIAGTGGVIGIWPPASIFHDMAALAGGFARMVEIVGVDHVALGTDMQGLVGPSTFGSYADLPALAAALFAHGFNREEVGKLLGGNYLRLFTASMA